ncbi:conserved hypothetical protein [Acinetobacter proteolyticus]|uniref:Uncharacterized protein n=1 Tax=Acinetobacter proteolyticus TaxID=1776741 RepID=A0A653KBV1_9GAMM|nr:hypothetical protein [Acinetobacter proteolyticus]VXA58252.1 conserved hypothetical protein [Acinetobacter proteolyticus]
MSMITLEPSRYMKRKTFGFENCKAIKKSVPFVEAKYGEYTHRVRHVTLITFQNKSHFSVKCWCGMSMNFGGSSKGQGMFVNEPSEGRPMCATCEGRAIGAGLLGVREIAGREVRFRVYGGRS